MHMLRNVLSELSIEAPTQAEYFRFAGASIWMFVSGAASFESSRFSRASNPGNRVLPPAWDRVQLVSAPVLHWGGCWIHVPGQCS
jgi:hypothetical protein